MPKLPLPLLLLAAGVSPAADPAPPLGVAVGPDGRQFVAAADGVRVVVNGKPEPFPTAVDRPTAVAAAREWVYVAGRDRVVRVGGKGPSMAPFAPPNAFPTPPRNLCAVTADAESGTAYVADAGDESGAGAAIYRVTPNGLVGLVTDPARLPGLKRPRALAMDGASFLLVADRGTGDLFRVRLADGSGEKVAGGLGECVGLAWDNFGRLFAADRAGGRLLAVPRPGVAPVVVRDGLTAPGGVAVDPAGKRVLVAETGAGVVTPVPAVVPGWEVDESPLPIGPELAFPNLKWTGWEPETDDGRANIFRPIVLTHAGDGSNRVFVATQHGVVHAVANDPAAAKSTVFLDLTDRVRYSDKQNEEGLLGLAFHPRFKQTGELFVFYTPQKETGVNVVSRFRVRPGEPGRADPASEEEVIRFRKPYWNHNGGTIAFGPDGMLYLTHGDGGAANDPFDNGQTLSSPLGKILRIDVDRRDAGKGYAVPPDNPFVGRPDASPEVWAFGLRNCWRMAFDPAAGDLWAADVGQNLYEEINLVRKGGNYGWNRREGLHPFGARGSGVSDKFVEPIWEYSHDVGKSVTGGTVYRGTALPELAGHYLYADYVSAKLWAMKYDAGKGRVVANRPLTDRKQPVLSFGQDEAGEVYLLTTAANGRGVFRFARGK